MAVECAACVARESEVAFLRAQVERLQGQLEKQQEQLVAALNPHVLAALQPPVSPPISMAAEPRTFLDGRGQAWVQLGDRAIEAEKYAALVSEAKYVQANGDTVSLDDAARADEMLSRMIAGG